MLPYGFATLAELKARLGINTSITDHNTTLQEIINGVSGAIESIAGPPLPPHCRIFHGRRLSDPNPNGSHCEGSFDPRI